MIDLTIFKCPIFILPNFYFFTQSKDESFHSEQSIIKTSQKQIPKMNHLTQQLSNLSFLESQRQLLDEQKTLHMNNLIEAFDDPSIKKLQEYNKNKMERELLQIAQNFHSMMDKLTAVMWFCKDYKTTLESYKNEQQKLMKEKQSKKQVENERKLITSGQMSKESQMIEQSQQGGIPLIFQQLRLNSMQRNPSTYTTPLQMQQQLSQEHQQSELYPKPLVVLHTRRLQTKKQQIQSVINKLKVMVIKVNTKESSSFQHVYSTYVSRLRYTLEHSSLKEKQFKMSIIKILLNYLRKKYVFMKIDAHNVYPYHPTRYPNPELNTIFNESPMFFVNFFVQQLLFFNCQPIRLKFGFSELLYCPIILVKGKAQQTLKISQWYYEHLTFIQPLWRSTVLLIKVFSVQTSLKHPVYYSCISLKKFQFQNDLKDQLDQIHSHFPFMEHTHHNQQKLLSDLQAIKDFIYQTLIFNHLKKILNLEPQTMIPLEKVHIEIQGGFRVEFEMIVDIQTRETLKNALSPKRNQSQRKPSISHIFGLPEPTNQSYPQPIYKTELITDFLLFYKKKNLFTLKRATVKQELQILFKATIFKILSQDIQYRTITPTYSGSLALYYYEKKTIQKNKVKDFLGNFGQQ